MCSSDLTRNVAAPAQVLSALLDVLDQLQQTGPVRRIVFPPFPQALAELQSEMRSADPDLHNVARIAAGDLGMSMVLMKAANSPWYGGRPVASIDQALGRLGLNQTAALMTGFLAQQAIRVDSPLLARFWERASKIAVASAFVARKLPGMVVDVAYTYGLFRHAGVAVMAQSCDGYAETLAAAVLDPTQDLAQLENARHQTDHAIVGALVARLWHLPAHVVAAIRLHHDTAVLAGARLDTEVCNLLAIGLVAEHFVRMDEGLSPDSD